VQIIPNFLVFEGCDGSGTTTQLALLGERFKNISKPSFVPAFEPTDGQIGRLIRRALKKEISLTPESLAYLFAADRNEHLYGPDGITEHVKKGSLVASDRYVLSSLVYQGIECGEELPSSLNSRFGAAELTIYLDIDPETALERMKGRDSVEIYEYREFQEKVRDRYRYYIDLYRTAGAKIEIIDASKSVQEVARQVWSIITRMPIFNT